MASSKKNTGMGADAFFGTPTTNQPTSQQVEQAAQIPQKTAQEEPPLPVLDKPERRSFNIRPSILRMLEEIQIKTIRDGNKQTLSAIVERGILLVASEKGVSE